jgi:hypothetical protein
MGTVVVMCDDQFTSIFVMLILIIRYMYSMRSYYFTSRRPSVSIDNKLSLFLSSEDRIS